MNIDSEVHEASRIGFSRNPINYDKVRPDYTFNVFNEMLDIFHLQGLESKNEKINVLDLAAGTGEFTKLLLTKEYFNVYAVEPNEKMKLIFKDNLPNVPIYDGVASNIPFENQFFQIVFIAQAFHWFANIESLREICRVLKPQDECKYGRSGLVLIWNAEDADEEDYIHEIRNAFNNYSAGVPQYYENAWRRVFKEKYDEIHEYFTDLETKFFKYKEVYLPLSVIWQRVTSISYVSCLDADEKNKLKKKIYEIFKKYESYQKKFDEFEEMCLNYPHYTELVWCFKK